MGTVVALKDSDALNNKPMLAGLSAIPPDWPHMRGPIHHLLEFQDHCCALCKRPFTWVLGTGQVPRQWVCEGLLQALVCYACSRRYTFGEVFVRDPVIARNLRSVSKRPPAQQCAATKGLGRQFPPRPFRARLDSTEPPTTSWRYYGTISHSLLLWQRGRCAICSTGLPVTSRPRSVHVDHDHGTGLIRGLLCHRCNVALEKTMPSGWWAHNTAFKRLYLANPPAKSLAATRGRTYSERHRPAQIALSQDGTEILSDSLPRSILEPGVTTHTWRSSAEVRDRRV
jgi:hypothetical protein